MTQLGKFKEFKIDVIASTPEQYITFRVKKENSKVQLTFIGSLQLLPASLGKLSNNLEENELNLLKGAFSTNTNLLRRKGVYPYEYFDKFETFDAKQLPPKSAFYSQLTDENISESDY